MTLQIVALIIVTFGFTALALYVFSPRNKTYFEDMSRIPLDQEKEGTHS